MLVITYVISYLIISYYFTRHSLMEATDEVHFYRTETRKNVRNAQVSMNLDNKVGSVLSYSSRRRNRNYVLSNEATPTSSRSLTSEEKNSDTLNQRSARLRRMRPQAEGTDGQRLLLVSTSIFFDFEFFFSTSNFFSPSIFFFFDCDFFFRLHILYISTHFLVFDYLFDSGLLILRFGHFVRNGTPWLLNEVSGIISSEL